MDRTTVLFTTIFAIMLLTIVYGLFLDRDLAESMAILLAFLAIPFFIYRIQHRRNVAKRKLAQEKE